MRRSTKTICMIVITALLIAMTPAVFAAQTEYAYIRIEGYEGTLVEKTAVPLNRFDLKAYGVTEEPSDYTVLHAVIYALKEKGHDPSKAKVLEANGGSYISSVLGLKAEGNAGWMYVLNDESSWNSVKDQKLEKDDYVVLYYIKDWMNCSYSTFGVADEYEVDAFTTVKLNLKHQVTDPVTWAASNENLAGAVITVDGKKTDAVTDEFGNAYLTFKDKGTHIISAEKYVDGINTISRPYAYIDVQGKGVAVNIYTTDKTYRACVEPKGFDLAKYDASSELEFSALHAIIATLNSNGFDAADPKIANYNKGSFISALAGVEASGNSAWMYTVNNQTSWFAVNEQPLTDGDVLDIYLLNDWATDTYSYFDMTSIKVQGGENIRVRLYRHVLDFVTWETSVHPYANCEITVNGHKAGYVTDNDGYVNLKFNKKGVYEISVLPKEDNISRASVTVDVTSDSDVSLEQYNDYAEVTDNYLTYMEKAVGKYIMNGDQDNNLRPADEITKAEFLTMLVRASKLDVPGKYRKRYTDVVAGNWFGSFAQAVFRYGLAKHDKGFLYPDAAVSSDIALYALNTAFASDAALSDAQKAVFAEGLTREEAAYLIISYMEATGR